MIDETPIIFHIIILKPIEKIVQVYRVNYNILNILINLTPDEYMYSNSTEESS